ncbi:hypothetical protein Pla22_23320 [Rubripirellula amarantea]|uniref:Methanolan biosynthesis EpsI domain-containing protein n=1 Tax=Rubripirellula amarantea TaxID=2527999 RepID=A0A5C5WXT3_9BACT|nr:exosortase-associated EpsI family protein [Rubripirellula amarantea]TWT54682.1 hypothetical protein Pla22_23320 [Rubripirellula amarantea]
MNTDENNSPSQPSAHLSNRRIAGAVVLGLTLFSGVVHGFMDGRWSKAEDLNLIGDRLELIPDRCGDWTLKEDQSLNTKAAELLRCYGSSVRVYHNEKRDTDVNVAVLFGPRGPIAVHTPEVCYSSVGTKQANETTKKSISTKNAKHQLWSVQFSLAPDPKPALDVWYAWSDGGDWQARNHPRFWMTDTLYKIQVAGPVTSDSEQPCEDFLKAFLPHLEEIVQ